MPVEGSVQPAPVSGHKLRIELNGGRGSGEIQPDGRFQFQAKGQRGDVVQATVWDGATRLQDTTETLGTGIPWGILLPGPPPPTTDNSIPRAVLFSVGFSVLAGLVELTSRSKADLASCFGKSPLLYVVLTGCFNSLAAALACGLLKDRIPGGPWLAPMFYALFGVFAFEGVLSNTNVTIFQKGVLAFEDWIAKAREPAVAEVLARQTQRDSDRTTKLARQLVKLSERDLYTYVIEAFPDSGAKLIDVSKDYSAKYGTDPRFYVALVFARKSPQAAVAAARQVG
ncbi:MAG: hypothetical protein ACLQU1_09565 [Bryobacteraceae bacterium]